LRRRSLARPARWPATHSTAPSPLLAYLVRIVHASIAAPKRVPAAVQNFKHYLFITLKKAAWPLPCGVSLVMWTSRRRVAKEFSGARYRVLNAINRDRSPTWFGTCSEGLLCAPEAHAIFLPKDTHTFLFGMAAGAGGGTNVMNMPKNFRA